MPTRRLSLLFAALALAACDAPTNVSPTRELFVLSEVAGQSLPAVLYPGGSLTIVADTFRLREDGSGVNIRQTRDTINDERYRTVGEFTWTQHDGRLEMSFPCPPNVRMMCVAPPHLAGPVTNGAWILDHAAWYELPSTFERITPR
jgi:hypothetical protein